MPPRNGPHAGGPRVSSLRTPNIGRCPIANWEGEPCGEDGNPMMPFVICGHHARKLYEHVHESFHAALPEAQRRKLTDNPNPVPVESGTVYWLQVGALIKVGFTTNLKNRLATYPPARRVLALEPQATRSLEAKRKAQFRHLVTHGQEWMRPAPDLIAFINVLRPDDRQIALTDVTDGAVAEPLDHEATA